MAWQLSATWVGRGGDRLLAGAAVELQVDRPSAADVRPAKASSENNWPQWRGAHLDGISLETDLPTKWSEDEGILWRLPLPGKAGATPVVWDKQIFLTSAEGDALLLMCVSTDGKEL